MSSLSLLTRAVAPRRVVRLPVTRGLSTGARLAPARVSRSSPFMPLRAPALPFAAPRRPMLARPAAQQQFQQRRFLNLHEYQCKKIMTDFNVRVQKGDVASTGAEAQKVAQKLLDEGAEDIVIKAQVHAGGRGKGHFDNGFKGGVQISTKPDEIGGYASKMIGANLITKQTGAEGQPVKKVLVHEGVFFDRELYFALLMDRQHNGPVIVTSPKGGMDIEEVAATSPQDIHTFPIDIEQGITSETTAAVAKVLGFEGSAFEDAQTQMKGLYNLFIKLDCTQVEINPLVTTRPSPAGKGGGLVYCIDAKLNFDDNAAFRQKELFGLRDTSMEDPREVAASEFGLNYIGLDGNIGCMVNGAGLAMATMDIIKLHGGDPANFLDVGGGADEKQVEAAFKILTSDSRVSAILVNIFGGIMKCDVIARGIVAAAKNIDLKVPLVVRLEGTNVEKGNEILASSGLKLITASNLDDAAKKAVKAIQ